MQVKKNLTWVSTIGKPVCHSWQVIKNDLKHSIFLKWIYDLVMRMRKLHITKLHGRMWNKLWDRLKHSTIRSHKSPFPSQQCAFLKYGGIISNSSIDEVTNQRAEEQCTSWELILSLKYTPQSGMQSQDQKLQIRFMAFSTHLKSVSSSPYFCDFFNSIAWKWF